MTFFADTSVLVAFSALGRLDILQGACSEVFVPEAVRREIVDDGPGWVHAMLIQRAIASAEWVTLCEIPQDRHISQLRQHFRRKDGSVCGEVEVMEGTRWRNGVALLDDKEARDWADTLGLRFMGVLGIIGTAKKSRLIDSCRPLVSELQSIGFRYGKPLVDSFLSKHGE